MLLLQQVPSLGRIKYFYLIQIYLIIFHFITFFAVLKILLSVSWFIIITNDLISFNVWQTNISEYSQPPCAYKETHILCTFCHHTSFYNSQYVIHLWPPHSFYPARLDSLCLTIPVLLNIWQHCWSNRLQGWMWSEGMLQPAGDSDLRFQAKRSGADGIRYQLISTSGHYYQFITRRNVSEPLPFSSVSLCSTETPAWFYVVSRWHH